MKKDKLLIIRIGKITPHTSMYNYFQNCMLPLAVRLKDRGYKVVFHTDIDIEGFEKIPFKFNNRRGIGHIIGMIFDEIQIALYKLFINKETLILNMNQLMPNVLCAKSSIMIIHDIMPLEYPEYWPLLHKYYKYYLGYMLKRCKAIITVSDTTKFKINQFYEISTNKITTIYNGIKFDDEDLSDVEQNQDSPFIYIGADLPNKNLELLTEIFSKVDDSICLNMIGGCCKNERVVKAAKQNKNIRLLGFVSEGELKKQYQNCKALVYPSISEGFGLPLVEAMWYGKPIIVADRDYAREVCKDYSVTFFDIENKEELISIINSFSYDKKVDIKNNRKKLIEKYSWCTAVKMFIDIINNIE